MQTCMNYVNRSLLESLDYKLIVLTVTLEVQVLIAPAPDRIRSLPFQRYN
jgi:hypothetical protein